MLTRLDRISQRAETHPEEVFNNLFSLLNYELLWYAFRRLKRGKTPGVDNVTVEDYEEDLEANLRDLLDRLHRGSYRPLPSLRKNIPKGNGKTRSAGHRLRGRQTCPTRGRDDPGANLRSRFL